MFQQATIGPKAKTSEWYLERKRRIGASSAGVACGVSKFAQPLDLYMEMTGLKDPPQETDAMRLGTALEPVVRSEFSHRTGFEIIADVPMVWRNETPWIACTLDGVIVPKEWHGKEYVKSLEFFAGCTEIFEAKTSTWHSENDYGEEGTDEVPDDYLLQCQQQMYVVDASVCHLAVLFDARNLKLYKIKRNEKVIGEIVEAETELWQRIQEMNPPDPDWDHPTIRKTIEGFHGVDLSSAVKLTAEAIAAWQLQDDLKGEIDKLTKRRESLRAYVAHTMGDACAGWIDDLRYVERKLIETAEYTVPGKSYVRMMEKALKPHKKG